MSKLTEKLQILSIGNSLYEYTALRNLASLNSDLILKSIKFVYEPNVNTMIDQVKCTRRTLLEEETNLHIKFTPNQYGK